MINGRQVATQGWILYGTKTKSKIKGHGLVPGGGQVLSSLRPELGGVLGALVAVDTILTSELYDDSSSPTPGSLHKSQVSALIDNMAVISRIRKWSMDGIAGVLEPEYDLLQASKTIANKHALLVNPQHVKSHQDVATEFDSLPWQAQLNCDCDYLADNCYSCSECNTSGHRHYSLIPGHGATLSINGTYITANMAKAIKEASYRQETINYISKNANWVDKSIFYRVDWQARLSASKRIPKERELTFFKLEFNLFATMSRRHKMDKAILPACPRCTRDEETFNHMLQCERIRSETLRSWEETRKMLRTPRFCSAILLQLESGILSWLQTTPPKWQGPRPNESDKIGSLILAAFHDQHIIGWDQALRGRLSKKWGDANNCYMTERFQLPPSQHDQQIPRIVFSLWRFSIDRWIARNEFIYGKNKGRPNCKEKRRDRSCNSGSVLVPPNLN